MRTLHFALLCCAASIHAPAGAQVSATPLDLSVIGGRPRGVSAPTHDVVFCLVQLDGVNSKTFCRSTDAGNSWSTVQIPEGAERSGLSCCALSDQLVWVAMSDVVGASGGAVWRSTDGGDTWEQRTTTQFADGFLNFVYFVSPDSGMAMGDPVDGYFEVQTTTDGGDTWTRTPQAALPTPLSGEYGLAHDFSAVGRNIWFDTNKGRVYHSADLGLSWDLSPVPAGSATSANVTFADALHGASHHVLSYASAYITSDGGASWTAQPIVPTLQVSHIRAVPGVPGAFVFNAQGPPRVLVTVDDFQTYTTLATTTGYAYGLQEVCMFDGTIGWIPEFATYQTNAMYRVTNTGVGLAETDLGERMHLFPNPATENAVLVTLNMPDAGVISLELVDLAGRSLCNEQVRGGPRRAHVLDLHDLAAGAYLVTARTSSGITTQRLVVE